MTREFGLDVLQPTFSNHYFDELIQGVRNKIKICSWLHRRRMTVVLAVGFAGWYVVQLAVVTLFGWSMAVWLFYIEDPSAVATPGLLFAPISHQLDTTTHLLGNLAFLVMVGSLVEPRLGARRIFALVIGLGYIGTYVTLILSSVIGGWVIAGASVGIFALLGYAGLACRGCAWLLLTRGSISSETVAAVVALAMVPLIPLFEATTGTLNPGHTIGLGLGIAAYGAVSGRLQGLVHTRF